MRPTLARQDGILRIDDALQLFLERQQTAGRITAPILAQLPLSAYEARALLDSVAVHADGLSDVDMRRLARFRGELVGPGAAWAHRTWGAVYANGNDLISASSEDWAIQLNPFSTVSYGVGVRTDGAGTTDRTTVMQNSRGARVTGHVGSSLYFHGQVTENQQRVVWPVSGDNTAPRLGFAKLRNGDTYDWAESVGVVGLRSRYLDIRAGRDRNRWGPAKSSVSLSNYSAPYDQVQIRVHFWRIAYTSLFAGFSSSKAPGAPPGDQIRRRKYGSLHRLDIALPGRLQLGFFEAIIFATDTLGVRARFDWSYANPMIFLRPVERDRGSPDNALLGGSMAWIPIPGIRLYGELLLDEFSSKQLGKRWWGNKFAWVTGVHVTDWPLSRLSVRTEISRVRPYTYSHQSEINAFVHHGDPLGFWGGSNAWDYMTFMEWQPTDRISASFVAAYTRQGRNGGGVNYGSDPTVSNETRAGAYDQAMLQGIRQNHTLVEGQIGFELLPSLVLEAALRYESLDDAETGLDRYVTPFIQVRWGMPFAWKRF